MAKNWSKIRLGDICQTNKSTYSLSEKWDYVNYLDTGNLTQDKVSDYQHIVLGQDKLPSRARRKVEVDDILYSTVRPNQLHYGIAKKLLPNTLVSTGFAVITVDKEKANSDFIYYYLTQNDVTETLQAIGEQSTSAYPSIKPSDIENLEISLPTLEEQEVIAHTLRSLDQKIEVNREINHHLAEILQVNLAQQLNEVHEKYRIGDLELTVSDHVANGSFKSLKENVELVEKPDYALFLRNVDLKNKLNGDRRYVTESSYEFLKKSRLYGHEVIISNVADVGSVHRVPKMNMPMVAGNNVVFLQADNGLLTDYLYVYFNSRLGQHDIESITSGSAQQKFNKTDFRNLEIPILNDKIIRNQITPLLRYMDNVNGEISRLIELRDSLLPRLMSGEISVTD